MRIKTYLKKTCPQLSRKRIERLLEEKQVLVNGRICSRNASVSEGDDIRIQGELLATALSANPDVGCRLLQTTDDFIFFHKEACVHTVAHDFDETQTAANWLLSVDLSLANISSPLESGLAHRLDHETSGVMVAARNRQAFNWLKGRFQERAVDKEYCCLAAAGILRPGEYVAFAGKHPKSKKRILICEKQAAGKKLTPIQTQIVSVKRVGRFDLVKIRLITGYRHQIRAHLANLGAPIVGDLIYGAIAAERLMLHSQKIGFFDEKGRLCHAESSCPF